MSPTKLTFLAIDTDGHQNTRFYPQSPTAHAFRIAVSRDKDWIDQDQIQELRWYADFPEKFEIEVIYG